MDKELLRWSYPESNGQWLNIWTEISDERCPWGSILQPGLFNVSINNTDRGIECTPSRPAGDTELCGAVDMPEEWDAIQGDLHKPEKWVHGNLLRFSKAKYKVVCLGQANPWYQQGLGDERTWGQPCQEGLGTASGWKAGQEPTMGTCRPERQLYPGLYPKKEVLPLSSAPVRHHLVYSIQL